MSQGLVRMFLVKTQAHGSVTSTRTLNLQLPRDAGGQVGERRRGVVSKIQAITENNQEQLATLLLHIRQALGDSALLHFQANAAVTLNYFQ